MIKKMDMMTYKNVAKVIASISFGLLLFPITSFSQDINMFKKEKDSLEILIIGKLDSTKTRILNHYLVTKVKKRNKVDTLWKSDQGRFSNDYIHFYDVYMDSSFCTFLFSSQFGMELALKEKKSNPSRYGYESISSFSIPIRGKEMMLEKISIIGKRTVKAEYLNKKVEIFVADSSRITKYIERKRGNTFYREKVKIRDEEKYLFDFDD